MTGNQEVKNVDECVAQAASELKIAANWSKGNFHNR